MNNTPVGVPSTMSPGMSLDASASANPLTKDAHRRRGLFSRIGEISEGRFWAYLLLLPSFLLVAAVVIYPVISGIWLSFNQFNIMSPQSKWMAMWLLK